MLSNLSIRNIVLIEAADVDFGGGLTVLTGETGAGKSIILDLLSLALGERADRSLIRTGAEQASVTATFEVAPGHAVYTALAEAGIEATAGEPLILRRTINVAGQSRAFVNDGAVSAQLLKTIGDLLLEVHGQGDERGLMDARGHRDLLDAFGGLQASTARTVLTYATWRQAEEAAREFAERSERAAAEQEFLRHAAEELAKLAPQPGEEASLAEERAVRLNSGRISEDVAEALSLLSNSDGLQSRLGQALRRLERAPEEARAVIGAAVAAFERTIIEANEAQGQLQSALEALRHDPKRLEAVEDRLFTLRAAARKYRVAADDLAAKKATIEAELAAVENSGAAAASLAKRATEARAAFIAAATELSRERGAATARMDAAVNRELAPLRLGKAEFATLIEELPLDRASAAGIDRVEFRVRTNSGTQPGPLKDIASGGETARFVLALKVVLAREGAASTLIFDEVDRGIGGAVADAVGERLARLAEGAQVLVVTHSPQVAARGHNHFLIEKRERKGTTAASITHLDATTRREEIARMLSGSKVTDEARAQAEQLLASGSDSAVKPKRRKASA